MKKVLSILLILAMMLITTFTFANSIEEVIYNNESEKVVVENTVANNILGFFQWIGYVIAIGMLIYIGIKYVSSAADERANLKNSLVKYIIGALLITAASSVVGWMANIGGSSTRAEKNSSQTVHSNFFIGGE